MDKESQSQRQRMQNYGGRDAYIMWTKLELENSMLILRIMQLLLCYKSNLVAVHLFANEIYAYVAICEGSLCVLCTVIMCGGCIVQNCIYSPQTQVRLQTATIFLSRISHSLHNVFRQL